MSSRMVADVSWVEFFKNMRQGIRPNSFPMICHREREALALSFHLELEVPIGRAQSNRIIEQDLGYLFQLGVVKVDVARI